MYYHAFFSPTGGTKAVTEYISRRFANSQEIDLSLEATDIHMTSSDFCIVGVPSFGGRVPTTAVNRLKRLYADNTPALIVVAYGNRAYEDTLAELRDVLKSRGFLCIGAAAIVTQHSIMPQFGAGRPDRDDYEKLDKFIAEIKERLSSACKEIDVPGSFPYKELHSSQMHPEANADCTKCGLCARLCPTHAIAPENPQTPCSESCIGCMRCVSVCPSKARKCSEEQLSALISRLTPFCSSRKECEFF